jgi:hypothetical protein
VTAAAPAGAPWGEVTPALREPQQQRRGRLRDRLLTRAQLATLPQPSPLIADTIDARTIVVLSGRRGRGKSLLALDWACCLATGKPWQERAVEPGPVLWIAAEGAYGMHQRVSAWEYAWQQPVEDLTVLPDVVNLYDGTAVDELVQVARDMRPVLVVVDTWARCTVGGKENDNSDATKATGRLEALRHLGVTTLLIAHTDAEDTKTRGATALEDNVDTVYRLKGDADHLVLNRTKRKDGPEHDEVHVRLREAADSVVVEAAGRVDTGSKADAILSTFRVHFTSSGGSKAQLRDVCREAGITSSGTFHRGVDALLRDGALVNTGTDKQPFYKLGGTHAR